MWACRIFQMAIETRKKYESCSYNRNLSSRIIMNQYQLLQMCHPLGNFHDFPMFYTHPFHGFPRSAAGSGTRMCIWSVRSTRALRPRRCKISSAMAEVAVSIFGGIDGRIWKHNINIYISYILCYIIYIHVIYILYIYIYIILYIYVYIYINL